MKKNVNENMKRQRENEKENINYKCFNYRTRVVGLEPLIRNKLQITKFLPLLPQFSDYGPEAFFREFESSATHFDLPKEDWTWLLKPKLNGKALAVLDRAEDNANYEVVKSAILSAYVVTTERYRQTFRNMNKTAGQTYLEFASEKLRALRNWLKSAAVPPMTNW